MESEQGISFTEFTYQLLQGYDFVHLCREHGVRVQASGAAGRGGVDRVETRTGAPRPGPAGVGATGLWLEPARGAPHPLLWRRISCCRV